MNQQSQNTDHIEIENERLRKEDESRKQFFKRMEENTKAFWEEAERKPKSPAKVLLFPSFNLFRLC